MDPAINSRRRRDVGDLKECISKGELRPLCHIKGKTNPTDPFTKEFTRHGVKDTMERLLELLRTGIYIPDM